MAFPVLRSRALPWLFHQQLEQSLEVVGGVEVDADRSLVLTDEREVHIGLKKFPELGFDAPGLRRPVVEPRLRGALLSLLRIGRSGLPGHPLDVADGEPSGYDLAGEIDHVALVADGEQCPRVTERDLRILKHASNPSW